MALRGDFQGGNAPLNLGLGGPSDGGNIAIEKLLKWRFAFFGGACMVLLTSLGTGFYWLSHFTFAPSTFFFTSFMLFFGVLMLTLDLPIPHMENHKHVQHIRGQIYKFALFMTRFVGRGVWYLFLATMVFGALWDTGINWFLGATCTAYLTVLGVVAMGKGVIMSNKLNRVREAITQSGHAADRYVSRGQTGLTPEQFKLMVESATNENDLFTPDELSYVVSALTFTPYNDGTVTLEELRYWLAPGLPLMV